MDNFFEILDRFPPAFKLCHVTVVLAVCLTGGFLLHVILEGKTGTSSSTKESLRKRFKSTGPDLIQPQRLSALSLAFAAATSGPDNVTVRVKRRIREKAERLACSIAVGEL